jgi:hypothetical protein
MNTVVVYDSHYGNTERIAQALADTVRAFGQAQAVACFDTRFRGRLWKSSAAPRIARQLRMLGVEPIVPPESFFVKAMKKEGPLLAGEVERAASWALGIHQQYKAQEAHLAAH